MSLLIPGNLLEKDITLTTDEIKDTKVLLYNHCLITTSDTEFSIINTKTLNFKYRGKLWLLDKGILFKGYEIISFQVQKDLNEPNKYKPICKVDYSKPVKIELPFSRITGTFIGHDDKFRKRFLNYSKLRIDYETEDYEDKSLYILFTNEDLLVIQNKNEEILKAWERDIKEKIPKKVSSLPVESIDENVVINELDNLLSEEEQIPLEDSYSALNVESSNNIKDAQIIEKAKKDEIETSETKEKITKKEIKKEEKKELEKISIDVIETLATPEKRKPKIGRVIIDMGEEEYLHEPKQKVISPVLLPSKESKDEPEEKNILYEVLKPDDTIEDLFIDTQNLQPDSSINRCKKCGWILRYDSLKCPRCGADTY